MISRETKKTLLSIGSQKDLAILIGISYGYFRTLLNNNDGRRIPLTIAKKIVQISNGRIKVEDLRPDLNWIFEEKTVEDKRKELGK